jgi:hypothetical protein
MIKTKLLFLAVGAMTQSSVFSAAPATDLRRVDFAEEMSSLNMCIDSGRIGITGSVDGRTSILYRPERAECHATHVVIGGVLTIENRRETGGCHCDYTLHIPGGADMSVTAGISDISVKAMSGRLKIEAGTGSVNAEGVAALDAAIGNMTGGTFSDIRGNIKLRSGTGSGVVRYSSIPATPLEIDAKFGTGGLEVSLPADSRVKLEPGASPSFMSRMVTEFPSVEAGYNFLVRWSLGVGNLSVKKN